MKKLTCCLFAIGLICGIARTASAVGMACPLFELIQLPGGTILYYADYYPTSCADQPHVTIIAGVFDPPADCWEGECEEVDGGAFLSSLHAPGLPGRVSANHVHDPGRLAAEYCRVSSEPDFRFIEFTLNDGDLVQHVVGKITTVEVTRPRPNGQPPKTRRVYVAFESVGRTSGSVPVRVKPHGLHRLNHYPHGYVATVQHPTRQESVQVLVLTEGRPMD